MLEMQRNSMLMYTSCGWFFNDVAGIETQQILQYADRAMQLAERESNLDLKSSFVKSLEAGHSNLPEMGSIRKIYEDYVSPRRMTLSKVGMHYAVHVLFSEDPDALQVFNYTVETTDFLRFRGGQQTLCMGRAIVRSKVTLSEKHLSFAVLYIGNHHLVGGTSNDYDAKNFREMADRLEKTFKDSHIASVIYELEEHFHQTRFSFFDLMKDEQKKILDEVIDSNVADVTSSISRIAKQNYSLLNLMRKQKLTVPRVLWQNLVSKLEFDLTNAIEIWGRTENHVPMLEVMDEFKSWDIKIPSEFGYKLSRALYQVIENGFINSEGFKELLEKFKEMDLDVDLIPVQNFVFQKLKSGENGTWLDLGAKISIEATVPSVKQA